MNFFKELKILSKALLNWLYVWLGLIVFFSFMGFKQFDILWFNFYLPWPSLDSMAVKLFAIMQKSLLPVGVSLIVTNPLAAFLAQVKIAVLAAFLVTFPLFLYKILGYIFPALYDKEKKAMLKILLPTLLLFVAGCCLAYLVIIPSTFKILYSYTAVMGATPLFSVSEFISLVFGLCLACGLLFLLPVVMILLSYLKITNQDFWRKNWRYAMIVFLIFSAIITPDGSGITMVMLAAPLSGLYLVGMMIGKNIKKVGNKEKLKL